MNAPAPTAPTATTAITQSGALRPLGALCATIALLAVYQSALVLACRRSVWFEVALSVVVPAAVALSGRLRFVHPRVMQLALIETYFCVVAIATKLCASASVGVRAAIGGLFAAFFVVQALGFVVAQRQRRSPHGVFQSAVLLGLVAHWWLGRASASGVIDADGRLLVFGVEAPLTVRVAYALWVSNVLLVQTRVLPRLEQAIVHGVSVAVALGSGEFFHARLLTACHLFVLDLAWGYTEREGAPRWLALSPRAMAAFDRWGRSALAWGASVAIALVALAQLARGWLTPP